MARILFVDDSNVSRRKLRGILELGGHDIIEMSNGKEALERYRLDRPDLVMLDIVMAGLNGLEVLAKLKELDPNACVVIATADIQTSTQTLAREAGACQLVTKPFLAEEVLDAVRMALGTLEPHGAGGPASC